MMTKVRTLVAHRNQFGERQEKAVGDEYELTDALAEMLVGEGLVEIVTIAEADDVQD